MTVREALSKNLRRIKKERKLTYADITELTGINKCSVLNWITQKNGTTLDCAWLLCRALGISIDDLVEGADE